MHCPSCASCRQAEFTAEINIHFRGLQNLDNPGLLMFPKVLVCFDCGFSQFAAPEGALAMLAGGTSAGETLICEGDSGKSRRPPQNCALRAE